MVIARDFAVFFGYLCGDRPGGRGAKITDRCGDPGHNGGDLDAGFCAPATLLRALRRDQRPADGVEIRIERHFTGLAAVITLGRHPLTSTHVEQAPMALRDPFAHDLVEKARLLQHRPAPVAQKPFAQFGEHRRLAEFEEPLAQLDEHLVGRRPVARHHLDFALEKGDTFPQAPRRRPFTRGRGDLLAGDGTG
jgi:hypothetical protein